MFIHTGLGSIEAEILTCDGHLLEFDLQVQSQVCATCYVASEAKAVLPHLAPVYPAPLLTVLILVRSTKSDIAL